MRCDQCNSAMINGVFCHEAGCPDSWKHITRECKWCGSEFEPESRDDIFCDESCGNAYNGIDDYDGVEDEEL